MGKATAPRRKGEAAAAVVQDSARHQAWARSHPERARAERTARLKTIRETKTYGHKREGTPATHAAAAARAQRPGSLQRLCLSGAISADELAAAAEIAAIAERIGADVAVKTASLETRIDSTGRPDLRSIETLGRIRREVAYSRWRREITALGAAGVVMDMIVGDTGIVQAAAAHGMHRRRAARLLTEALALWGRFKDEAHRDVDERDVTYAEMRLNAPV